MARFKPLFFGQGSTVPDTHTFCLCPWIRVMTASPPQTEPSLGQSSPSLPAPWRLSSQLDQDFHIFVLLLVKGANNFFSFFFSYNWFKERILKHLCIFGWQSLEQAVLSPSLYVSLVMRLVCFWDILWLNSCVVSPCGAGMLEIGLSWGPNVGPKLWSADQWIWLWIESQC